MKLPLSLLLLLSVTISSRAQDSLTDIVKQRIVGQPLHDLFSVNFLQKDSDSGYIIIAANSSPASNNFGYDDVFITKLDSLYNLQWQKTFGSDGEDIPGGIVPAIGGGYVFTCQINGSGRDFQGVDSSRGNWMIRLDAKGNLLWKKQFRGPYEEAVITSNGTDAYFLASFSYDELYGLHRNNTDKIRGDVLVQKMDTSGNLLWAHCFGGLLDEFVSTIISTVDGDVVCIGRTYADHIDAYGGETNPDIWIIRISTTGQLEWQQSLGTEMWDSGTNIRELEDGSFLVTGGVNDNAHAVPEDGYLAKISKTGELLWEHIAPGTKVDKFFDALPMNDGGIIAVGYTESPERNGFKQWGDVWVYSVDKEGKKLWERCYGGYYVERGFNIIPLNNGNFLVFGLTMSIDGDIEGKSDKFVDGWLFEIAGSQKKPPGDMGGTGPLLPGLSGRFGRLLDPEFPGQIISVYPNPFRGRIMLQGLQVAKKYEVIVYNSLGQRIIQRTISNKSQEELLLPAKDKEYYIMINDLNNKRMLGTIKVMSN